MIRVSSCPLITPSFRSTVTPGKFPTCWLDPVNWLNSVVFPLFWFPTSAKVSFVPSGSGSPLPLGWNFPSSPRPGWAICFALRFLFCSSSSESFITSTEETPILSASSNRSVSSYPRRRTSMGSPRGANLTTLTFVPGVIPMSRRCCLVAPSPPMESMMADSPIFNSFNVLIFYSS